MNAMRLFAEAPVLLAATLLIVCAINPDHFPPWTSFHTEAPAFAAAILLLASTARNRVRLGFPALFAAALLSTAMLQYAVGLITYRGDVWVVAVYLMTFAAAWLWASTSINGGGETRPLEVIAGVLLAMGLLNAFQNIAQWLQLESFFAGWLYSPVGVRSTGNFGQPNQSSTMILMGVAAQATLMVQGRVGRITAWIVLVLSAWAVALTQSRTGLVSATVMVAGFVALTFVRPVLRSYRWDAVAWLAALCVFALTLQSVHWDFTRGSVGGEVMTSVGLRPVLWKQFLASLSDQPWIGYGWLQIAAAQQVGAASVPGMEQVNYTHNLALDVLVMLGLPLGTILLATLAFWGYQRVRSLTQDDGTATAALFMLAPFAFHSMLELPHAYSYMLVLAGALCGIFAAHTKPAGTAATVALPRWCAVAMPLILAAMMMALAVEYLRVEEDFRVNRFENRRLGEVPPGYSPPTMHLLDQMGELMAAMRLRGIRQMPSEDLDLLVRTTRRFTWAPLHFRAALALGLNGRPDEAREQLEVIRNLFPKDIVLEGRDNWLRLQGEYPELGVVEFPEVR